MNARRTLFIAGKLLIELVREPRVFALTLLTPVCFLLIVIFGYQSVVPRTHIVHAYRVGTAPSGLLDALELAAYADGRRTFTVVNVDDPESGRVAVESGRSDLFLTLPAPGGREILDVYGDAASAGFIHASAELERVVLAYHERLGVAIPPVRIEEASLTGGRIVRESDAYLPGMTVFALLLLIPQTALLLGREIRTGTLKRIGLSPVRSSELFGGIALGQLVTSVPMIIVMYGTTLLFSGLNPGDFRIYLASGLILALSSTGLGLAVACFVENDSQAVNIGASVSMIQVFLSGCFFPVSFPSVGMIAGREIQAGDFLPPVQCMTALREALLYGSGIRETSFRLLFAFLLSVLYFIPGILIFKARSASVRLRGSAG